MPEPNSRTVKRRSSSSTTIVMGIDPGTLVTGYGVVARKSNQIRLLECGTIVNKGSVSLPLRLMNIAEKLREVIERVQPDEFAIESAFYGKNAQSALKLGHARGVSILTAVERDIPTTEYSPREVKKAVVGKGSASKDQVQFMVKSLLHITDDSMVHDASDALAVALCHAQRLIQPAGKYRSWKAYIAANPGRVKQ